MNILLSCSATYGSKAATDSWVKSMSMGLNHIVESTGCTNLYPCTCD